MDELKSLIVAVGSRFVVPEQWEDLVEQVSLLFDAVVPKLLVEEMQSSQSQDMPEIITDDNTKATNRSVSGQADYRQKFEQCYAKCSVQLRLTKIVAEIIASFFDQLSIEQVQILLQSLDSQYKFATQFNSELNLRFRLWKNGYMA